MRIAKKKNAWTALILSVALAFTFMPTIGQPDLALAKAKRPGKVTGLKVTTYGTVVSSRWKAAKRAKRYQVQVQLKKGKKWKTVKTAKRSKYGRWFEYAKGKPGKLYRVRVRALAKKPGKWCKPKSVRVKRKSSSGSSSQGGGASTEAAEDLTIKEVKISVDMKTYSVPAIFASWNKPSGHVKNYYVEAQKKNGNAWETVDTVRNADTYTEYSYFDNEKTGGTFRVRVRANGSSDTGSWAESKSVTISADPGNNEYVVSQEAIENARKYTYEFEEVKQYPTYLENDGASTVVWIRTDNPSLNIGGLVNYTNEYGYPDLKDIPGDLTIKNITTGKITCKAGDHCGRAGDASSCYDVEYADREKGILKRGGYLIGLPLGKNAVIGSNTCEIYVGNYKLGQITVTVKDTYENGYKEFIKNVVDEGKERKMGPYHVDPERVPNWELQQDMLYVQEYLKSILTYNNYQHFPYLLKDGAYFDVKMVGCEGAAQFLRDAYIYMGVQAETKWGPNAVGDAHMSVRVTNPESWGWSDWDYDASPPRCNIPDRYGHTFDYEDYVWTSEESPWPYLL